MRRRHIQALIGMVSPSMRSKDDMLLLDSNYLGSTWVPDALNRVGVRLTSSRSEWDLYKEYFGQASMFGAVLQLHDAIGEGGGTGGGDPEVVRGPYICENPGDTVLLTKLSSADVAAIGIASGFRGTLGVRVSGDYSGGNGISRNTSFVVNNVGGTLSTVGYAAGADIEIGNEPGLTNWGTTVRIASDGSGIEVLATSPEDESTWWVEVWVASLAPLSVAEVTDESPEVTLTLPTTSSSMQVPVTGVRTPSITGVYCSESDTLTEEDVLIPLPLPSTVTVAGAGARSIYYWGARTGGLTARKVATTTVILDSDPPAVTAFTLSTETGSLEATVTALTADETPVDWYYNFTGVLPATPTWVPAPSSITLPGWGSTTVYVWCRDAAGNVSESANATVNVMESGTIYFQDTFDRAEPGENYFGAPNVSTVIAITDGALTATGDAFSFRGLAASCSGAVPANNYYVTFKLPASTINHNSSGVAILRPPTLAPGDTGGGVQLYNRTDGSLTTLHLAVVDGLSNNITEDDAGVVVVNAPPASWTSATGSTEVWVTFHVGLVESVQSVTVYANGVAWKRIATDYNPGAGSMLAPWLGDMWGGAPVINEILVTDYLPEYA